MKKQSNDMLKKLEKNMKIDLDSNDIIVENTNQQDNSNIYAVDFYDHKKKKKPFETDQNKFGTASNNTQSMGTFMTGNDGEDKAKRAELEDNMIMKLHNRTGNTRESLDDMLYKLEEQEKQTDSSDEIYRKLEATMQDNRRSMGFAERNMKEISNTLDVLNKNLDVDPHSDNRIEVQGQLVKQGSRKSLGRSSSKSKMLTNEERGISDDAKAIMNEFLENKGRGKRSAIEDDEDRRRERARLALPKAIQKRMYK